MEISASSKRKIPFFVLIAAAGHGSRLGGSTPKQYRKINGKAILRHTLDMFLSCADLQMLCVIIDPQHRSLYDDAVQGLSLAPPIEGSDSRKSSIYNGLKYFSNLDNKDIILTHDAARPFVSQENIIDLVKSAYEHQAATLAIPVTDTQRYKKRDYIDRHDLWSIQTPQAFHYGLLRKAHEQADSKTLYNDDTSLVAAIGHDIEFVPGSRMNIKITTQDDLMLAHKLMPPESETRTGFGYDVHAFEEGDSVKLCDIPHHKKLKGHSDADAGLHALTDALLGTIGAGDIGSHFPPTDPRWKNADSTLFLQKALALVKEKGGRLVHLDLTLICEEPKIAPYRDSMQMRVAQICGLTFDRVGLKATTTEKLGFLGRGEGIAAQAVASVCFSSHKDQRC